MKLNQYQAKKIIEPKDLSSTLQLWRFLNKKVVFTNGVFDLLHPGHIEYLNNARDLGDVLIIGLNADASVKRLKGENRPINLQQDRALMLAGLECVTAIVLFDEDTPLNLIKKVLPDVLVKGGDYNRDTIVGADEVESHGGRVEVIPFKEGYSSTTLIQRIQGAQNG
jgi:D-beta-D-heptose 7-phosphate kinase/D-beta-D-heptose 1-phosphate adenosyltransferase